MPEKATVERARRDMRRGKSASTAAGEFVREEMHHVREGKHGARSTKQAIAIGLSKARRSGVPLKTRNAQDAREERRAGKKPSRTRSRATERALKREPHRAASHRALSKQAHGAAARRTHAQRSAAAKKAARTRARHRR